MSYAKMTRLTLIVLICVVASTRVAPLATADCVGAHCHPTTTPDPDRTISLYWTNGDSCFKVGEYNPFLENQENPTTCGLDSEMYWKLPSEMTPDERKAMGITDEYYAALEREGMI